MEATMDPYEDVSSNFCEEFCCDRYGKQGGSNFKTVVIMKTHLSIVTKKVTEETNLF